MDNLDGDVVWEAGLRATIREVGQAASEITEVIVAGAVSRQQAQPVLDALEAKQRRLSARLHSQHQPTAARAKAAKHVSPGDEELANLLKRTLDHLQTAEHYYSGSDQHASENDAVVQLQIDIVDALRARGIAPYDD